MADARLFTKEINLLSKNCLIDVLLGLNHKERIKLLERMRYAENYLQILANISITCISAVEGLNRVVSEAEQRYRISPSENNLAYIREYKDKIAKYMKLAEEVEAMEKKFAIESDNPGLDLTLYSPKMGRQ